MFVIESVKHVISFFS